MRPAPPQPKEPDDLSLLRSLAAENQVPTPDHDTGAGGRAALRSRPLIVYRSLASRLRPTVKYATMDYFDFLIGEVKSRRRLTVYDSERIGTTIYGLTVFDDEYWLWKGIEKPFGYVEAIVVRRDAASREVIDAVLKDDRAVGLLGEGASQFERVIIEYEEVLARAGYGDVAEKVKAIVALSLLLA